MSEPGATVQAVRATAEGEGLWIVRSPAVGWWSQSASAGEIVGAGSRLGTLQRLHQRIQLVLAEGPAARVQEVSRERRVAVEFGQQLLALGPLDGGARPGQRDPEPEREVGPRTDLPPGTWAIVAPTDGMFYRSLSPGAPPLVEPGSRIRHGQPVGLVEVMKTFHQILYGGPGSPPDAEVLDVRCADRQEVQAGQILVVVR